MKRQVYTLKNRQRGNTSNLTAGELFLLVNETQTAADITATSELTNDGDGSSPFATEQLVEDGLALKLDAADYNEYYKGKYLTEAALNAAHPTGQDGWTAIVDAGAGTEAVEYIWDAEDGWIAGSSMSATTTDALAEGSINLYFSTARVLATALTGISFLTGGAVVSTDSVLVAIGKIQKQINDLSTVYQVILTDTVLGSLIAGFNGKTTPVNGDSLLISDSADTNKAKKVSLTNFKAFMKSYYDTVYAAITHSHAISDVTGLQAALDSHARELINDTTDRSTNTVTPTTAEQIIANLPLLSTDLKASSMLTLATSLLKTGTAGTWSVKIYLNTTANSLSGAVLLSTYNATPTTTYIYDFFKRFSINASNLIYGFPSGLATGLTSVNVGNTGPTSSTLTLGVVQNLIVTITLGNSADVATLKNLQLISSK